MLKGVVILLLIILGGVIFFSIYNMVRKEKPVLTTVESEKPTLPEVCMLVGGMKANAMEGYLQQMDEVSMRDGITPITTDRELQLQIQPYDRTIRDVSYEVTDLTDGTLVENGTVADLEQDDTEITGKFVLQTPILMNQEYGLRITLTGGNGEEIYYYTRILQTGTEDFSPYLSFSEEFYQTALDKNRIEELTDYMESSADAANQTFHEMDISASLDQVSWGDLAPELVLEAVPEICEITQNTVSVKLEYVIRADGDSGEPEEYTVKDFFRMRNSEEKMYLLDFYRETNQIFTAGASAAYETGLNLGIGSPEPQIAESSSGNIAAFVVNGDLWTYNSKSGLAARVFSFRDAEGENDLRTEAQNYAIQIKNITDKGNVQFLVYGYFSSGQHEGQAGVALYQYDAAQNVQEEKLFIPLQKGFDWMRQNLGKTAYCTDDQLYLFLGTELIRADLQDGSYAVVQDALSPENYLASDSQKMAAWTDSGEETAASATLMDLETGEQIELKAPEGEKIRLFGFMNEDVVYGLVREEDILTDEAGNVVSGMYRLCISSADGQIAKDYQRDGLYITDVTNEENQLSLTLGSRTENGYTDAGSDHIMNNVSAQKKVTVSSIVTDKKETQVTISFAETEQAAELTAAYAEYLPSTEEQPELQLELPEELSQENMYYFVYGRGELLSVETQANRAIQKADEAAGTVLDSHQKYIWQRAGWADEYKINLDAVPQAVLTAGTMDASALQEALGDGYSVVNLSGCEKEDVYYLINQGYAVFGKTGEGESVLIVGYDLYNIWVYDPTAEDQMKAIGTNDSTEMFADAGNVFLGYEKNTAGV